MGDEMHFINFMIISPERHNVIIYMVALVLLILVFLRAKNSRKIYKCPDCGESFRVELMDSSHCNVCGTNVKNSAESNYTNKV